MSKANTKKGTNKKRKDTRCLTPPPLVRETHNSHRSVSRSVVSEKLEYEKKLIVVCGKSRDLAGWRVGVWSPGNQNLKRS